MTADWRTIGPFFLYASRRPSEEGMAIKRVWLGITSALLTVAAAQAQTTIDVAKITCEQFVLMTVAPPDYIVIWLSGYYHGKRNSTTIDVQKLKENAQKVRTHCLYNKGTLMDAVEKVVSSGQ